MKKIFLIFNLLLLILFVSCSESTETPITNNDDYTSFVEKYNCISNDLAISMMDKNENISISPSSIINLLAIIYESSSSENREKIASYFEVDQGKLGDYFVKLFKSLQQEHYGIKYNDDGSSYNDITGGFYIDNSFWYNNNYTVYDEKATELTAKYNLNANKVKFNEETNNIIINHIKNATNGMIDLTNTLKFPEQTLYSLINVQYLTDIWKNKKLTLTEETYSFTNSEGYKKDTKLLIGSYIDGKTITKEKYSYFYTETKNKYKIKFIVPNEKYTVNDILNKETLTEVNQIKDFNALSDSGKTQSTRCIFPAFETSYNENILSYLNSYFNNLFDDNNLLCTLLNSNNTKANQIIHATNVNIDENGVKAAAVTAMTNYTGIDINKDLYDFVINKEFVYIITDSNDVELFIGQVKTI